MPIVKCAHCGKEVSRQENKIKKSKTGLFFCSRKCHQAEQRIGGKLEVAHYGTKNKEIFKYYCVCCGKQIDNKNKKYCCDECREKHLELQDLLLDRREDFPKEGWRIEKEIKKGDYLYAVVKNHPKSDRHGYVLYHRIVAENKIKRLLKSNEVVHHINGNKHDNRPENLKVMNVSDHASKHSKKFQNGHTVELKCAECGKIFKRKYNRRPEVINCKNSFCSRRCNGTYQRREQLNQGRYSLRNK